MKGTPRKGQCLRRGRQSWVPEALKEWCAQTVPMTHDADDLTCLTLSEKRKINKAQKPHTVKEVFFLFFFFNVFTWNLKMKHLKVIYWLSCQLQETHPCGGKTATVDIILALKLGLLRPSLSEFPLARRHLQALAGSWEASGPRSQLQVHAGMAKFNHQSSSSCAEAEPHQFRDDVTSLHQPCLEPWQDQMTLRCQLGNEHQLWKASTVNTTL